MNCKQCELIDWKMVEKKLSDELATAREQNRQLVETVKWLEAQINANKA